MDCRKEGLLDNTHNEFQSYNDADMTCYGHFLIDVRDKVTKKYHPIQILRDEHRHAKDTDQPCSIILVRFGKGDI